MRSKNRATQRAVIILIVGLLWLTASATPLFAQARATVTDTGARYSVAFTATWSEESHPHPEDRFPTTNAHFSPLIGAVHSSDVTFWSAGKLASAGIEQMAESGATGLLRGEISAAIDDGSAHGVVSGAGAVSPGGTLINEVEVSVDHPLVTLVTMIAPSPDRFVGISGESLLDGDKQWVAEQTFTLYPYDAGTDSGSDYTSPNTDSDPAELIHSLRDQSPFSNAPIGTFTFTRIDEPQFLVYMPVVRNE